METQEGLGDNNGGGLQLEVDDHSFRPVSKGNAGEYIFEKSGGVAHWPQKNVNDVIKERWKNQLLQPGRLSICFQLS